MLLRRLLPLALVPVLTLSLTACDRDGATPPTPGEKTTAESAGDATATTGTTSTDSPTSIDVGHGIAGIEVGGDPEDAVAILGEPDDRSEAPNELSGETDQVLTWKRPAIEVRAVTVPTDGDVVEHGEITRIQTTDPEVRTEDDLGVGSTRQELLKVYPDADCDGDGAELGVCRLGRGQAGDVVTDWFVQGGKVIRVVVGRVID